MKLSKEARQIEVAKKLAYAIVYDKKSPRSLTPKEITLIKRAYSKKGLAEAISVVLLAQEKRRKAMQHARTSLRKTNAILKTRGLTTKVVRKRK